MDRIRAVANEIDEATPRALTGDTRQVTSKDKFYLDTYHLSLLLGFGAVDIVFQKLLRSSAGTDDRKLF